MVLRMTGRLSVPAQMSALGRVHTAGPDALPLWQKRAGSLPPKPYRGCKSTQSVNINAVKSTVARLIEGMCRKLDCLSQ